MLNLALGIVSIGYLPKSDRRAVGLALPSQVGRESRGGPDYQHQGAGRQRMERAQVPDALRTRDAAHPVHHIVARAVARFVHQYNAIHKTLS